MGLEATGQGLSSGIEGMVDQISCGQPIRVLSDLHLGHPASMLKDVMQIEPLLEGVRTIVFNGDTFELLPGDLRTGSLRHRDAIENLCSGHGVTPLFINGNHDPDVSGLDHLDLMGGRVMVTHGHVLFPEITPWGRDARKLFESYTNALQKLSAGGKPRLQDLFEAARRACIAAFAGSCAGPSRETMSWIRWVFREMCHPCRPFRVLRAWAVVPGMAADFARAHRPSAKVVLFGHTHLPGIWKRGDALVVNTGSYLPGLGRRVVDLENDLLLVRAVARKGKAFMAGRTLLERPVADSPKCEPIKRH